MQDGLPPRELPPEKYVDVWAIALDTSLDLAEKLGSILSAEERERASRFVFAKDAARFRVCRGMLRLGLAWYLREHPREIGLTTRWRGKPRLATDVPLYFNVSHSKGFAAIGFASAGEVGIDLEAMARDVDAIEVASAHFTSGERSWIASESGPREQVGRFLNIWTKKEAVLKAAGCGIYLGMDTFEVSPDTACEVTLQGASEEIAGRDWRVQVVDVADGYSAAVAAPPGDWVVRQWQFCDDESIGRLLLFLEE